jgi:hypothetical protein
VDVIKYLLKIPSNNININIDNNFGFREACKNNHVDIVTYLIKLHDNYIAKIQNNKIVSWKIILKLKNKVDYEVEECPICMECISNIITDCKHQLCRKCCYKINNVCHMCRNNVKTYFDIEC